MKINLDATQALLGPARQGAPGVGGQMAGTSLAPPGLPSRPLGLPAAAALRAGLLSHGCRDGLPGTSLADFCSREGWYKPP